MENCGPGFHFLPGFQVGRQSNTATILVRGLSVAVPPPEVEFFFSAALLELLVVDPVGIDFEILDGLAEREPPFFHDEIDDIAPGAASPADETFLIGIDAKRGLLFLVKRTQAPKEAFFSW